MQCPSITDLFATATETQLARLTRAAFATARREHGTDSHAVAAAAGHYVVEVLDARDMRQRVKLANTLMLD